MNWLISLISLLETKFPDFLGSVFGMIFFSKILGLKVITWLYLAFELLLIFALLSFLLLLLLLLLLMLLLLLLLLLLFDKVNACWTSSLLNPSSILSFSWNDFLRLFPTFSPWNLASFTDIFPSIYCFMQLSTAGLTLFLNVFVCWISGFLTCRLSVILNSLNNSNIMLLKLFITICLFILCDLPINKLVKPTIFFLIFLKFCFIKSNSLIISSFIVFTLSIALLFSSKTNCFWRKNIQKKVK